MNNPKPSQLALDLLARINGNANIAFDPATHQARGGGVMADGVLITPAWATPEQPPQQQQQAATQPTGATYDQIKAQLDQLQQILRNLGADTE